MNNDKNDNLMDEEPLNGSESENITGGKAAREDLFSGYRCRYCGMVFSNSAEYAAHLINGECPGLKW